jgi:hypothetical protein
MHSTLAQLVGLDLLNVDSDGRWHLTAIGTEVLDARSHGNWTPLVLLLLRAGDLERDVISFLGEAKVSKDCAVLPRKRARTISPVMATIVDWVPEWRDDRLFIMPLDVLRSAMADAAMEIAEGRPGWVADRERVGHRAEAYSLRLERELCGAGSILHISRDGGDRYGYDLEDISTQPSRLIECKGSRSRDLNFIVSANELAVARRHPDRYEVHHWAQINLGRAPDEDYAALRGMGYPTVIKDLDGALERRDLTAECVAWQIKSSP